MTHAMPPFEETRALRFSAGGELADALEAFIKPDLRTRLGENALYLYGSKIVRLPPMSERWPDEPLYEEAAVGRYGRTSWSTFNQYEHLLTSINNQKFNLWPNFTYEYTERSLKLHFMVHALGQQAAKIIRPPFYDKTLDPDSRAISLHRRIPKTVMVGGSVVNEALGRMRTIMGVNDETVDDYAPRDEVYVYMPTLVDPFRSLSVVLPSRDISSETR